MCVLESRVYVSRQTPVYLSRRIPNNILRNQMPAAEFFHIVIVNPSLKRHGEASLYSTSEVKVRVPDVL